MYGAVLYSFFDNYAKQCVDQQNCQSAMVDVEGTANNINLFGLSTKAAVSMVSTSLPGYTIGGGRTVSSLNILDSDNRNNFCATLALWTPA
jgi:hypothetical protein